ncbi:MAG: hypothetical protein HY611_10015 [Elusimicrobia bacterium]|nr:hypothetical protein [Elusimicrobiota bacterium]
MSLPADGHDPHLKRFHTRILVGAEIEAYSISAADYGIGRRLSRPRPGLSESGERFTRDSSIGSEYNSRPFATVRESLFLLKSGLRKYLRRFYRGKVPKHHRRFPLLVGGWTNRFAGTHLHISVAARRLDHRQARSLAWHIHDHIPLLVAIGANSPVWRKRLTGRASVRLLRGSRKYFTPVRRGRLGADENCEIVFSPGRKSKPPTLEIRVLDSNLPEFIVASICVVKAVALRWLRRKAAANRVRHQDYLHARLDAGFRGLKCRLPWNGKWLTVSKYIDRFVWEHREELEEMDVPGEVYETLRLIKRGYNGARILHDAVALAQAEHPQTWQRRFAKRYSRGLERLLSGDSLWDFSKALGVPLPDTESTWLGRKGASIDE